MRLPSHEAPATVIGPMAGAVVFDLDALVDLSALSAERRGARWGEMRGRLDEARPRTRPGDSLAMPELPAWAVELGTKVGIVTDLPKPVAEALVNEFDVECDELIDASAEFAAGPNPEAMQAMAERLGVASAEILAFGSSPADFSAAGNAGACSAGVSWAEAGGDGWNGWRPDIGLRSADSVVDAIEAGPAMRPIAEVLAEGGVPVAHWGSLLRLGDSTFAAGRHFSATDRRLAAHELSKLILRAKDGPAAAERLGEIIGEAAGLPDLPGADLVVSVPGGRNATFDRFAVARVRVAEKLGARDGGGALEMVKPCDNYTDLDRDQRRMANHGRFSATTPLDGESVVLIDDVITSGSQTRACRRELLSAGASAVWALTAAASQDPLRRECPHCGGGVMRRVYGRIGPFYACTRFGCDYTEPWDG
jgi:predicted amidophosphoribosyltransferase